MTPSHPAYWQERYEAGDTRWDKGCPSPPLEAFLSARPVAGNVLVPGCGSGHDVRLLAAGGATVTGMDFAPGALAMAASVPAAGNERYVQGDFLDLPGEFAGAFDWVFEHTCYCAIEPSRRDDYVRSCLRALRTGGGLLAIFYLDTGDPPDVGPPFSTDREEVARRFGPHFEVEYAEVPAVAYPGREGREWLWLGRKSG